jgi:GTP-binding protein HflX
VSWIHDNAHVEEVTYGDEEVVVDFEARPAVVERSRARAADLATPTESV